MTATLVDANFKILTNFSLLFFDVEMIFKAKALPL